MQPLITVSIQGQEASFHEIAAKSYYTHPFELRYRDSFEEVFQDLVAGSSDKIFVATDNSTHGVIKEVEVLAKTHAVSSEGSFSLPIDQHLIAIPGANISDIKEVISHPVALSQCKNFFERNPTIKQLPYHDTAAAAKKVKYDNKPNVAAIGSSTSAVLHGLEILQEAIQDDSKNTTTFHSFSLGK